MISTPKPSLARACCIWLLLAGWLLPAFGLLAQPVLVTEFMAANNSGLADEGGEFSDWIELYNTTSGSVPLQGWSLSDDPKAPAQWRFPAVTLPARGFMVVFASGKNRVDPKGKLHTNFKLSPEGGSLLLANPDGEIVSAFLKYPRQISDVSYGISMAAQVDALASTNSAAKVLVPANGALAASWMKPEFDDSAWTAATAGAGYDRIPPGQVDPNEPPTTLADITAPGDTLAATSANSPFNEGVVNVIDNDPATKYLNFDKLNAGFTVVPKDDSRVVTALEFTSANDAPERDPTSFVLSGSNDGTTFTEIARGPIPAFGGRFTPVRVTFANTAAYHRYRLLFPTVQNAAAAVAMQIAEVQFLGQNGEVAPSFTPFLNSSLESALFGQRASAYLRIPFTVREGQTFENLALRLRYDDGFAAWLNGVAVAQANAPAGLGYNSLAPTNRFRRDAVREVLLDLTRFAGTLHRGGNVLAIQGWNDRLDSPDFLLQARLENRRFTIESEGYFDAPSPGAENTRGKAGIVEDVLPSEPHGYFDAPFDLTLACPTPGATIRYTTNGSPPTATTGILYTGPIGIARFTVLRAAAFLDGWLPSRVATRTYIFLDDTINQSQANTVAAGFPSKWITVNADYGMDPRVIGPTGQDKFGGKYRRTIKSDLLSLPAVSMVMDRDDMFGPLGIYPNAEAHGEVWERRASIELINPNQSPGFQRDAGVRIQGGAFRRFDLSLKKSFRVIFREEYGASSLSFPLFGPNAAQDFNNFVLRANANDAYPYGGGSALYVRDAFSMETVRAMGSVSSHTGYVHLFINGLYWGMYNLVERPDAAFSATYHGGDKETWDAINQDSAPDGNFDAWNRMLNSLSQDFTKNDVYQRIQGNNPDGTRNPAYEDLIDVDSLIDYMMLNFFIGNSDWPGRNWWTSRDRNDGDGFKFHPWDSETALGFTDVNYNATGVTGAVASPYAALRRNAEFRLRFADHVYRHFFNGGVFYVNPAKKAWDPAHPENNRPAARLFALSELVRQGMVGESARWGDQLNANPYTRDEHWVPARNFLLGSYFPSRSGIVLDQFRQAGLYPKTDAPVMNVHGGEVQLGFQLVMTATKGSIYYTTNGLDPRLPVSFQEISRIVFASSGSPKKALVPSPANGGDKLAAQWLGGLEPFNDSAWQAGTGAVGYDTQGDYAPYIGTDVRTDMAGLNASAFIRIPFDYDGAGKDALNFMVLRMRCDDGFAAFLNGVKIASTNAPATLDWSAQATSSNPDSAAVVFQDFRADKGLGALKIGRNILAIQGLNSSASGSDFLIDAELVAGQARMVTNTQSVFQYSGPITLAGNPTIKARALNVAEWSALNEAKFVVGKPKLVVTELNYHPAKASVAERAAGFSDADDFEFIEFWNNGTAAYDLTGLSFAAGVQFTFPASSLPPGSYGLLVKSRAAFGQRYGKGFPILGEYSGNFGNGGERVRLLDAGRNAVLDFSYGAASPWPTEADGGGATLEVIDPDGDLDAVTNWRASTIGVGSPGAKNPPPAVRLLNIAFDGSQLSFGFDGRAALAYTVSATDSLSGGTWEHVQKGEPLPDNRRVEIRIDIPKDAGARFFRVSGQ